MFYETDHKFMDMTKKFRYILLAFIGLLGSSAPALSQSQVERELENMVMTAVEKYNDRDYEAAQDILSDVVEADPSADAAWYYLALCSAAEKDVEAVKAAAFSVLGVSRPTKQERLIGDF